MLDRADLSDEQKQSILIAMKRLLRGGGDVVYGEAEAGEVIPNPDHRFVIPGPRLRRVPA